MTEPLTRKIVHIDEALCDGCGQCVPSCAEGAIRIIDGKARLVSEIYCDGLGACLGVCPLGAITIEERSAEAFDPEAVERHLGGGEQACASSGQSCPGSAFRELDILGGARASAAPKPASGTASSTGDSRLGHWPVQLTLLPPEGPLWNDADVLLVADCVPCAMPDFHERLLEGKTVAMACPKLDDVAPYIQKLAHIFSTNPISSVTVAHMEVPCCGGLLRLVQAALAESGKKDLPLKDVTIGVQGEILAERRQAAP